MAHLTLVKSARDNKKGRVCRRCAKPIKKGDSYFWFANRIGRSSRKSTFCADHRPRPSEMTTSDKLSQLYAAREAVEDAMRRSDDNGNTVSLEDYKEAVQAALEDAASTARDVGEEYRDSKSNLPDSLQDSQTGQDIEEKADACDAWADELESAASEIESYEAEVPDDLEEGDEPDLDSQFEELEEIASRALEALEL